MPLRLFYEWQAYARLQPFTSQLIIDNAAMSSSTFYNTMVSLWAKKPRRKKISDFRLIYKSTEHQKSPKELYMAIKTGFMMSVGVIDKRENH